MKKSYKIIIGIIVTIVILWGIIFFIDYSRCANLKEPIFVIPGVSANDGNSETYYGLGYKVQMEKTSLEEDEPGLTKIEMYIFDKFIVGSISDINNIVEIDETDNTVIIKNNEITVELMHKYIKENGYELAITDTKYHHEIYLSDPRKGDPNKLKTVVRHPIRLKNKE